MLLGKKFIELALKKGWIYCNPKPKNITEVSIDVTLGNGAWFQKENEINPLWFAEDQFLWIDDISRMYIDPGEMVIAYTEEFVGSKVGWITPQIRTRSTAARWGLEVGTAALFGEPGFHSRWALELHNVSSKRVMINPGWRVGQVIFQLTIGGELYTRQYNKPEEEWTPKTLLPKTMDK